jgi:hypothetical protein
MDFNGLLLDSFTFAERVFRRVQTQVQAQLSPDDAAAPKSLDELLSDVLVDRLTRIVADTGAVDENTAVNGAIAEFEQPIVDHLVNDPSALAELLMRDSLLSAALGACVCWGERGDCPLCEGAGTPGWAAPDEQLYVSYVQPAVVAAARCHSFVHPPSFTPSDPEVDRDA